ncbi:NAD(P)-binding protein [Violaceomyces palustris]|uniref:NAD(P)-binding protein n=1 Tax=Violaceomyces palustris TaxID=1673888 RepID=A0ACD0P512_9BASI|nr:NAD(P)-binding protein [Violaceomyces palustris]
MSKSSLILLTGGTGFVGAHVLHEILTTTDHRVRVMVRSDSKVDFIRNSYRDQGSERLEFFELRDMHCAGSLSSSKALEGVEYIIHVASPFQLKVGDNRKDLIEPAVEMTRNVLEAANEVGRSVKRIVFTGSSSAILNPLRGMVNRDHTYTEKDWNPFTNAWLASWYGPLSYLTSKVLSERLIWEFVERDKPRFDVTVICPAIVYGPLLHKVDSASDLNESCRWVYELLDNESVPKDKFPPFCDVRDVAKVHVLALENEKASNQRYLLCSGNVSWQKVCDSVHDDPELSAISKRLPVGRTGFDTLPKPLAVLDSTKVVNHFGIRFRDWEDSVIHGCLKQLVELEKTWAKGGEKGVKDGI